MDSNPNNDWLDEMRQHIHSSLSQAKDDEAQQTKGQVESYFRLQPSLYTGWDVVQTSLLDDLLA